jgi:DNA invertase Pin-like site-specific DNA recombinase
MTEITYADVPAYARLSRKKKGGQIESIPLQLKTLDRLAGYRGDTIGLRYDDASKSAWDQSVHRPGWEAFLAELDTGAHKAAFSYHADRLSRNGMDTERLLAIGARWGIVLITPEGIYDLGNDDQRAMFRMLASMTINQSDATSRRARNHKNEARRQGNLRIVYGGPPPLGFRQGEDDWQVDPEQASYLADAAKRVLTGESVLAIHRALGPMTDSTGRTVTVKMLRNALARPATAGRITTTDGQVLGWAPGGGPLDEDTFAAVERVLAGHRGKGRRPRPDLYPFGPVLRCGKCGNQLTGNPGWKGRAYYACRNPHKGLQASPCRGVSVPAEDVHELLYDAVMRWANSEQGRQAAARTPQTGDRRAELEAEIADLEMQLAGLAAQRLRTRTALAKDQFAGLAAEAEQAIGRAEAELAELAVVEAEGGLPVVVEWDSLTAAEKLRIVAQAVETPIAVQPGNGGGAALSAADRIDLFPRWETA